MLRRCLRISIVRWCNWHCRPVSSCPAMAGLIPSLHCQKEKIQLTANFQLTWSPAFATDMTTAQNQPPMLSPHLKSCVVVSLLHDKASGNSCGMEGKRDHGKCCPTKHVSKKTPVVFALTCFETQTDIAFKESLITHCTASTCNGTQKTFHHGFDNVQQNSELG